MDKEYKPKFNQRLYFCDGFTTELFYPNRFHRFINHANDLEGLLDDAYVVDTINCKTNRRMFYQSVRIDTLSAIHRPNVNSFYDAINKQNESYTADLLLMEAGTDYKSAKHRAEWFDAMAHEEQHKFYLDPPDERRKLQELTDDFNDFFKRCKIRSQ